LDTSEVFGQVAGTFYVRRVNCQEKVTDPVRDWGGVLWRLYNVACIVT
jgi:hypothetical protein